ncbi:MAG: hypothetical protein ACOY4F_12105, partial [Thermodesulfobacteriota bacterium]
MSIPALRNLRVVACLACFVLHGAGIAHALTAVPDMAARGWRMDPELGVQLAFFRAMAPRPGRNFLAAPPVLLTPQSTAHGPDITNIALSGILGLGFPLPTTRNPDADVFYLKLFTYPDSLDQVVSTGAVFADFLVDRLSEFPALRDFAAKSGNVRVKKGHIAPKGHSFTPQNPYPPLVVPRHSVRVGGKTLSPQQWFDASLPFSSIYLTPAEPEPAGLLEAARAAWSAGGVVAFHREILAFYARTLPELSGVDGAKFRYFLASPGTVGAGTVSILKIPREPFVFANYADLPMPQDPDTVFLSGLLLLYRTDYAAGPGAPLLADVTVGSSIFRRHYAARKAHVFEVGSVVRVKGK